MNTVIYKYALATTEQQDLHLPVGSYLLDIQVQYNHPVMWIVADPNAELEPVVITTIVTGMIQDQEIVFGDYLGTYQLHDGKFVGHVFVRRN